MSKLSLKKENVFRKMSIYQEDLGVEPTAAYKIQFHVNDLGQLEKTIIHQNPNRSKGHSRKVSIANKNDYMLDDKYNWNIKELSNDLSCNKTKYITRKKEKSKTYSLANSNHKLMPNTQANINSIDQKLILNENCLFNKNLISVQPKLSETHLNVGNWSENFGKLSLINLRKLLNSNNDQSENNFIFTKKNRTQNLNAKKGPKNKDKQKLLIDTEEKIIRNQATFNIKYAGRLSESPINDLRFDPKSVNGLEEMKNTPIANKSINNYYVTQENFSKNLNQTNSEKKKNKTWFSFFKMCFCK